MSQSTKTKKAKRRKSPAPSVHLVTSVAFDIGDVLPVKLVGHGQYLINVIARRKMAGKVDAYGRALLNFDLLAKVMGTRHTASVIYAMIDAGVIVRDNHYVVGQKSIGYDLSPAVGAGRFVFGAATPEIGQKVATSYGNRWKPPLTKTHQHLRKWVCKVRIPNVAAAHAVINAQGYARADIGLVRLSVESLHDGSVSKDNCRPDPYGRFHTPIVRLKRELRPFLRLGRRPLVAIDIKNCQPLLVALAQQLCDVDPLLLDPSRFAAVFTSHTYIARPESLADAQAQPDGAQGEAAALQEQRGDTHRTEEDTEEDRTPIMTSQKEVNGAQVDYWSLLKVNLAARSRGLTHEVLQKTPVVTTRAVSACYPPRRNGDEAGTERRRGSTVNGKAMSRCEGAMHTPGVCQTSAGCPTDVSRYVELCERGVFYENLMASPLLASVLPSDHEEARDFIKVAILAVYFGNPSEIGRWSRPLRAIDSAIKAEFPTIHEFLQTLRRVKRADGTPGYAHAACTLQNIESSIIVNGVCTTLMNERPDMPLLTIHDALIVPDVDVEYVQGVIRAEFAQWGLSPAMKAEPLAPQATVAAVA